MRLYRLNGEQFQRKIEECLKGGQSCDMASKVSRRVFSWMNMLLICPLLLLLWIFWSSSVKQSPQELDFWLVKIGSSDVDHSIEFVEPVDNFQKNCTLDLCFDIYRCAQTQESKLLAYIYPVQQYVDKNGEVYNPLSKEFISILRAIIDSGYYTDDPAKACLFVPPVDTLNLNIINVEKIGRVLQSLPYWNNGRNHLIFNLIPGPSYILHQKKSFVALNQAVLGAAGFSTWTFRRGFDISLPLLNPMTLPLMGHPKSSRRWLLTAPHVFDPSYQHNLSLLAKEFPALLLLSWCDELDTNFTRRCGDKVEYSYPSVLEDSIFCLADGNQLGHPDLLDFAMAGCIPVIVGGSYVLPFSDVLDWNRASIQIYEQELPEVMDILHQISEQRIKELRTQLLHYWNSYFQSMTKITKTALDVLNGRVFPHLAKRYSDWNEHGNDAPLVKPLFLPIIAPKESGFTAVVLTYDRLDNLFEVIKKLGRVPSLAKVLVVWNNQNKSPPAASVWPKITKPLKVVQTRENKLSNRFYPYEEIETEAIFALDDDIVMLTVDEIQFAFEAWCEFPDRLVGFPSRVHLLSQDGNNTSWKYESIWTNDISMVLTGAAFYHKYYNYLYTKEMPAAIRTWVDEHMNCEDIAMNFLIGNVTGQPPIKVTPRKKFKCPECTNQEISGDIGHMIERSTCINHFAAIYNSMPLRTVEFRADPVLYKDNVPSRLLLYKDIGPL